MDLGPILALGTLLPALHLAPTAQLEAVGGAPALGYLGFEPFREEAVLHYRVIDATGQELANSERRGLPIVRRRAERTWEGDLAAGLRGGGWRLLVVPAKTVPPSAIGVVPPAVDLMVWLYIPAGGRPSPRSAKDAPAELGS